MTLPDPELSRILREFSLLLHSGIGGADSAFLLAREEQEPLQSLLNSLGEEMDRGSPLSEAMNRSGAFPEQVRAMTAIGEETGRLEEALQGLADFYGQRSRTRQQIRGAVAYPAMVLALMALVVGVLLVKVLPVFDRVYSSLGTRLTGPAAGLLYLGRLLEGALPGLFAFLIILTAAGICLGFFPGFREKLVSFWKYRFGDRGIARKFNNARFARALAMGLAGGLTVEESMVLAEELLRDVPGAACRCAGCTCAVEEGNSFTAALEQFELLPASQCRLLQTGYRSGNADQVMETIAETMTEEAQNALEQAVSAIEPAMVLVSSLLVGLILLSVMLPLADILSVLG